MRLMKSVILTTAGLILLVAAVAGAQTKAMQEPMSDNLQVEHHVAMLKDSLSLTDTQTVKISTILMAEHQQLMADRQKYSSDTKALQKARMTLRDTTDKQIKDVLNADQQKKYDQLMKEMKKQGYRKHKMDQNGNPDYKVKK